MDAQTLADRINGCLVRGRYNIVVGGVKRDENTVVRAGVPLDEFKGGVSRVFTSKEGHTLVCVRTVNRITAGDRMSATDEQLAAAAADPRLYKGLPGEYQFRSYRVEGIRELEVWTGREWEHVIFASFDELTRRIEENQAAASGGRVDDGVPGGMSRFDTWGEGGF